MKNKLKKLLIERAFKYNEEPVFRLASGKFSQFYIDCKMVTLYSKGMVLVGNIILDLIDNLNIKAIGGLTLGADPIANSVAIVAGQKGLDMKAFVIRKQPKKHGLTKLIEGDVSSGDRAVIIEDVLTTGSSVIQAIKEAEKFGLNITKVITLVDREEGGKEAVLKIGYEIASIFTKTELLRGYNEFSNI